MSEPKGSPLPRTEMDALLLGRLDELTVNEAGNRGRSFMSILVSIIVLMLISSIIVAAIVIINPEITNFGQRYATREAITIEEALLGELSASSFDSNWLSSIDANQADQMLYEESKNLYLVTIPPGQHTSRPKGVQQETNRLQPIVSDDSHSQQASLVQFTPNITTLVSNSSLLASIKYQGYKLSPSKRYLLIWTSRRKQFRHSFTAKYFIYDIKLDLISLLSTRSLAQKQKPQQYEQLDTASSYLNDPFFEHTSAAIAQKNEEHIRFQMVEWFSASVTSTTSPPTNIDSLILIQNNDIYLMGINQDSLVQASVSDPQQAPDKILTPTRLTWSGKSHELFNGVPNWLYEEEILGDTPAFQVSPNSQHLAYISFNDSQVSSMPYSIYGDQIIPRVQRIRYPKAGQPNPRVSVHVIENLPQLVRSAQDNNADTTNGQSATDDEYGQTTRTQDIRVELPVELATRQHYIHRMYWLTSEKLALIWSNRNQNESYILICFGQANSGQERSWPCVKHLHTQAKGGWLDIGDDLFPLDGESFLALVPKFEGPQVGNFKHLARVSLSSPNQFVFLTSGRKDILAINAVDMGRSIVYFTSTVLDQPGQRQLFAVGLRSLPTGGNPQSNNSEQQQRIEQRKQGALYSGPRTANNDTDEDDASVCVTCGHYPSECLYNSAKLSVSTEYYVFQCEGPDVPRTELRTTNHVASWLAKRPDSAPITGGSEATATNHPNGLHSTNSSQPSEPPPNESWSSSSRLISDTETRTGTNAEAAVTAAASASASAARVRLQSQFSSLLWTIEDNRELREKLQFTKAMPLTMRLKLPIANTSYQADVLLLLPPQLGPTGTFQQRASLLGSTAAAPGQAHRARRSSGQATGPHSAQASQMRPLHSYYTLETIHEYVNQLPSGQQYPMVVDVYAGPGSQKVDFRYNVYFGHYLATSRRTIYALIDGRGSGFQGTMRLYELYQRFGSVEIQDQIDTVQQLTQRLPFIDSSKVAIWGWSYGGYAAAMALAQSNLRSIQAMQSKLAPVPATANTTNRAEINPPKPASLGASATISSLANALSLRSLTLQNSGGLNSAPVSSLRGVFECAASVAPVTNWILYDTAYTERYMGSPWRNDLFDEMKFGDHVKQAQPHMSDNQTTQSNGNDAAAAAAAKTAGGNSHLQSSRLIEMMAAKHANASTDPTKLPSAPRNSIYDLNERYRKASLLDKISNIDRKRFLLIHGTADDNVHFQQSIMLMKKLIQNNILFETRLYPDQDHGIANKADKLHLGSTLSNFFAECFDIAY